MIPEEAFPAGEVAFPSSETHSSTIISQNASVKQAVEEEEDYESLPADTSHFIHLLAGGLAGMTEHCAMYPFDAIKVNIKTMMH